MDSPSANALVPVPAVPVELPAAARLAHAFLAGRSKSTARAYQGDLEDFARWLEVDDQAAAVGRLLGSGHGAANLLALDYRAQLQGRGLSPATVNRRLA